MALRSTPLAAGEIHRDFETDVLQGLKQHDATMHGCPVWKVESKIDGKLTIWFKGARDGVEWQGAMRFNLLEAKPLMGNVEACVDHALQILASIAARGSQPLIQRAQA
ncbi:hypothetical protein [uncultured Devosia sp.]|uniref:hypothetical protein n=1 Tax=uncultured Devosia sp. TaxID=211434 RepID=UPI00260991F7|nr:hypothetical protein [uncultured Devosia sp.]